MAPRRLPYTPAESKCLEWKSTAPIFLKQLHEKYDYEVHQ
jgi:hypothetical protein